MAGNNKGDNLTLARILEANKEELVKLAHECNLKVTAKAAKYEIQILLIEHNQLLSPGVSVSLSPSPKPASPSPSPSMEEMRRREFELKERR